MNFKQTTLVGFILAILTSGTIAGAHSINGSPKSTVKLEQFEQVYFKSTTDILAAIGAPQAHYHRDNAEFWLYGNVIKTDKTSKQKLSPEIMVREGKGSQANWHPVEKLKQGIKIAKSFGNWEPPKSIKEKAFVLADTRAAGWSKAAVIKKFGQPDGKFVFDGIETWEYKKVRFDKKNKQTFTLLVEFNGDKVLRTLG